MQKTNEYCRIIDFHGSCNSLTVITKQLVKLLLESPNFSVNVNEAAEKFKVQKRRINDVTLVLEGAGLIYRSKKNVINWRVSSDMEYLSNKESEIDGLIKNAMFGLMKLKQDKDLAYVTRRDFDMAYSDKTVMGLKVPPNTKMKVPEDMSKNGIKLYFQSEDSPIQLFIDDDYTV